MQDMLVFYLNNGKEILGYMLSSGEYGFCIKTLNGEIKYIPYATVYNIENLSK